MDHREVTVPKTSRRTWQLFEARAAEFFGAKRNVLSGSSNREDRDSSDSTHERLHIECKLAQKFTIYSLWDKTRAAAVKAAERLKRPPKIPVVALQLKHRPGFLLCIHSDDFPAVVNEWQKDNIEFLVVDWLAKLTPDEHTQINAAAIRRRYSR